jgi:hypothetical protein
VRVQRPIGALAWHGWSFHAAINLMGFLFLLPQLMDH